MNALRTDLNAFLFAPIAQDASGVTLTVLSALARTGVDPWDEAADLAGLSRDSATQRMTTLLATVPNGPSPGDDTKTLATLLVALLHRSPPPKARIPEASSHEAPPLKVVKRSKGVNPAIYYLAALIFMLFVQWALSTRHTPTPMDTSIKQDPTR